MHRTIYASAFYSVNTILNILSLSVKDPVRQLQFQHQIGIIQVQSRQFFDLIHSSEQRCPVDK